MAPKQSTLGKFFGNQNGSKAAPQQSTLSFSNKASTKLAASKAEVKEEPAGNETVKVEKNGTDDIEMSDGHGIKDEPEEELASSTRATGSTSKAHSKGTSTDEPTPNGKKRGASPVKEENASEDEPPSKKQRKKGTAQPVTKTKSKAVKTEPAEDTDLPAAASTVASDEDKTDPKPTKVDNAAAKATNAAPSQTSKVPAEAPPKPKVKAADAEPAETESEDESDIESEEEEKPEKAAKVRAKVQSTLGSIKKNPYPDWKPGEPVPYLALCTTFSKIELTTKRLEILAHCSLFLRQVARLTPDDLLPTILLMLGKLAADYAGIELGIGESLIMKAIGETTGRNQSIIKADQQEIGDLGLVAARSRANQPTMFKPKPLTVRGVFAGLMDIARVEGKGSQDRKVGGIKKLLSAADVNLDKKIDIEHDKGGPSESKFIVRTLEGKMRLGLADKTVLVALAQAMVYHEVAGHDNKIPSTDQLAKGENILKNVYNELPSYEVIIPTLLKNGVWQLREACKLQPGVPLKPMLAKPTKSIGEVLDRFEGKELTCEYKYDGERAQIHFVSHDAPQDYATPVPTAGKSDKGISNIFSRNSEDLSKKYPDILAKLPTWIKEETKSFVLDCETVAWDVQEKKVLPFQQLMTRKRKDVKVEDVKVKVCVFAFDLLYLNGEAVVNRPFRQRRELMYNALHEVEGEFLFAKYGNTNELEEIQLLLEDSVKASCEGLMVKMLDGVESHYEPSRRSQNWLKVKKDYLSGAGDSLDLVVLGAYFGKGKRTSVYGAFLLACYNPSTQKYETVCNIGTGFSEVLLESLHATLSPLVIDRPKPFYAHSAGNKDQPDVWFEARLVWEVKTADLTLSPRYRAAASEVADPSGKGVSLRFPRYVRDREDKKPDDATTARQVADMYRRQESVGKTKGPSVDDDFEY